MLEDIDGADGGEAEPLSLPDWDEQQLRREKREQIAETPIEELRAELARMDAEESEWCERYGVDAPDELRDTIDDRMDYDERRERRRVAYYWQQNQHVRGMIEEVLGRDG